MEYQIARNSRRCSVSGRELAPGEVFYSALVQTETGLERRDFAREHWNGPPAGALGHWRGRLPPAGAAPIDRPRLLDNDQMLAVLEKLQSLHEPRQQRLAYVLALLLVRRKALKLHAAEKTDHGEFLLLSKGKSVEKLRVHDPQLSEDQIEQVEAELNVLLETTDA